MSKLVTIIMPVYNAGTYLRISLDSILSQSYQNFEIIAVDDGSTDNSCEILSSYGDRVTRISQPNKGPSSARNTGIRKANGEYIAFLDADDLWMPTKLEMQVRFLEENPDVEFVYTDFFIIDSAGTHIGNIHFEEILDQQELINTMLVRNVMNGANSSSLMKKICFDKAGYFDETMKGCEDRDMWMRIARNCTVRVIQEPLMQYRFHPSNAHKNIPMMQQGQQRFLQKNAADASWLIKRKAQGYIYLDIAREYAAISRKSKAAISSLKSCLSYPFKIYRDDNKYWILMKSLIPTSLIEIFHLLKRNGE